MAPRFFNVSISLIFFAKVLLMPFEAGAQAPPVADFIASDSSICPGVPLNFFDLSSDSPTSYTWYFQGATPETSTAQNPTGIVFNHIGAYTVVLIVSNPYGSDTLYKTGYINVIGNFLIKLDTLVYSGSSVTLWAAGGSTYLWTPGGSNSDTMVVTPTETTVYHCTIFDPATSCTVDEMVKVWIIYDYLYVANTFHPTPDYPTISVHGGDSNKKPLQSLRWSIYDRWGEKIFESTDVNMDINQTGWTGNYQGTPCNTGVYVYTLTVTFADGEIWTKNGNITLLR